MDGLAPLVRALVVVAVAALSCVASASSSRPLVTGVAVTGLGGSNDALALKRVAAAGGQDVRVTVDWSAVAPARPAKGSDPSDPGNPAYDWSSLDAQSGRSSRTG